MSERPFMLVHVPNFLADTRMLSTEQIGAYVLLLMQADRNGGSLPLDTFKLRRVVGYSKTAWASLWRDLSGYFEQRDGFLVSLHLEAWAEREREAKVRKPLSAAMRSFILHRDGRRCSYCGNYDGPFHIDHRVAVARGGTDDPENLCVACSTCNLSKGAKLLEEWL